MFRKLHQATAVLLDLDTQLLETIPVAVLTFGTQKEQGIDAYADPNQPEFPAKPNVKLFDNIAVAQADSAGMICDNTKATQAFISGNYPNPPLGTLGLPKNLFKWFYDLNSRFILNPGPRQGLQSAVADGRSPVAQTEDSSGEYRFQ